MLKTITRDSTLAFEMKKLVEVASKLHKVPRQYGGRALAKRLDAFEALMSEAAALTADRARVVARKATAKSQLRALAAQLRAAVRGIYGLDSPEYAEIGGTRTSARRRGRKPNAHEERVPQTERRVGGFPAAEP